MEGVKLSRIPRERKPPHRSLTLGASLANGRGKLQVMAAAASRIRRGGKETPVNKGNKKATRFEWEAAFLS